MAQTYRFVITIMENRSMADQDTDRWVFEVLAPEIRRKMKTLKDDIQWTDLVYGSPTNSLLWYSLFGRAQCLSDAHARGITKEQIQGALRIMPFVCRE